MIFARLESRDRLFQTVENGDGVTAADGFYQNAVETVRVIVHEHAFAERVHLHERFQEILAALEIDLPSAVGKVRGKTGVRFDQIEVAVYLRDDADILQLFLRRKFDDRGLSQPFGERSQNLGTFVIVTPVIQFLLDDSLVNIHGNERFEIFEINCPKSVEAAVGVEEHVKLVLIAVEIFLNLLAAQHFR